MNYECELNDARHLVLQNEDQQTVVRVGRMEAQSSESKTVEFTTGKWSGKPRVREGADGCVVRLETADGPRFLHLEGEALSVVDLAPTLKGAREIPLRESDAAALPKMEAMRPLEPMKPMKPMSSLQTLR